MRRDEWLSAERRGAGLRRSRRAARASRRGAPRPRGRRSSAPGRPGGSPRTGASARARAAPSRGRRSARTRSRASTIPRPSARTTSALWCCQAIVAVSGSTPSFAQSRRRFLRTLSGSSSVRTPRLSDANGPSLTPPSRLENAIRYGPGAFHSKSVIAPRYCRMTRVVRVEHPREDVPELLVEDEDEPEDREHADLVELRPAGVHRPRHHRRRRCGSRRAAGSG